MKQAITGSMLRDMVQCERRVHHDVHSSHARRDPVSDFVQMLWAGGCVHEDAVLKELSGVVVDLRDVPATEQVEATIAAASGQVDWILGARLEVGDRLGRPDLLHVVGGRLYAGDVKSGTPFADEYGTVKVEYGVQVGHYAAILRDAGLGEGDRAFIIGRDGELVWYDLSAPTGRRSSLRDRVADLVDQGRAIRDGSVLTRAALSSTCGLCHWRTVCRDELEAEDDLTLVAGLGRSLRGLIETVVPDVTALAAMDVDGVKIPGVGKERLGRFRDRARLLRTEGAEPFARVPLGVRRHARELHFDLESDPMRSGLVYLHGILVRTWVDGIDREEFVHFFAEDDADEGRAFAEAFAFLTADPDAHIFYYSKFERTAYRLLQSRHTWACSPEDVERLFDPERATDLYFDVVASRTEWPLGSYGIKPIAKYLGFKWRDADASGAASIAWYAEYRETGDVAARHRIVEYNEDDCRATTVLLDALVKLPVGAFPSWPPRAAGRMISDTSYSILSA